MSFGIAEARPPYVEFEYKPVEDRDQSIEKGAIVYKDVAFARITPAGGRDYIEKNAEEWLKQIKDKAMKGEYDPRWSDHFNAQYKAWRDGQELPIEGTPILMCGFFTPAQQRQILSGNVRTLEDLASASEDTLARIGMGSREFKEKAQKSLATAEGGKIALQHEALTVKLADALARVESLEAANRKLKAQAKQGNLVEE